MTYSYATLLYTTKHSGPRIEHDQQSSALLRRFDARLWAVCGKCSNMLFEILWHGCYMAALLPPPRRAGLVPW